MISRRSARFTSIDAPLVERKVASAVAMFTWASCMGIVFAGTVRSAMVQAFAACTLLNSKLFR